MDEGVDEELHVEITTNMRPDNDIKTMHPDMEIDEVIASQSRECGQEEFMFWCQRCEVMRSALCPLHGKPRICPDTPRLTLAEASLPNGLYINRTHRGIFCSKAFTVNTVFGPFVAPPVDSQDDISDKDKILPFGLNEGCVRYLNPLEENVCNWMMFVRPAQLWSEINVMLYEADKKLYFVTTKTLQSKGSELKYGYTSQYADCYGLQVLEKDSQFACEPCGMTFLSKMNMMRHCKSSKCIGERLTVRNTTVKEEPYIGENRKDSESTVPATRSPQEDIIVRVKSRSFTANPAIRLLKGKRLKSSRRMQCHVCKLGFDSKQLMGIHMLRHRTREDSLDENEMFSPHCPQCDEEFLEAAELFDHIDTQHSKRVGKPASRLSSDELTDDMMTGGDNLILSDNRLVMTDHTEIQADHQYDRTGSTMTCEICSKQVTTASQLAVHMKTHDNDGDKFYKCFMCHEAFSSCKSVGEHVKVHAVDGKYYCPQCPNKVFEDWKKCRKHIKVIHSGREFPCVHCDRVFSRPDKLRLHSLTHTNVRNHMCDICGRQFARRDKLQEHIKKIHDDREDGDAAGVPLYQTGGSKFKPRVPASEYHRFIYKCLDCSLGFKRRGMLVNHLAKCHPSVAMSSIPELNLPILRTQREFYCQHCNRSYKSSTKRKMHMLKCHPGCSIPTNNISQPVGNVTTFPFACEYCHKQYASKAKLTEHKKMKHMDYLTGEKLPPPSMIQSLNDNRMNEQSTSAADIANQDVVTLIQPLDPNTGEPVTISLQGINLTADGSRVDANDLLTQAMSVNELQGLQASFDFQQQQQLGGAGSQHQIITSGGLEFRVIPNSNVSIDLNSLQMAGLSNNGSITFTVPTSSMGQVHPIQNQIITTTNNIPNLNSTAMPNTTSPKDWSYPVKLL